MVGSHKLKSPASLQWVELAKVNLLIGKQRNGPTGDVHLTFLKPYTRFESASKIGDIE